MTEQPKTPRDLTRHLKRNSLRAIADHYALRAKRQTSPFERQRLAEAAEHYRELAKLEEEIGEMRPRPPAPST